MVTIFTAIFVAIIVTAFAIIPFPIICKGNARAKKDHKSCYRE